jgi:hypothetical protein
MQFAVCDIHVQAVPLKKQLVTGMKLPCFSDLDEKYRKRDRYGGGMITDFKDKDGYKPEIQLEYVDDSGRCLNPKEAFRQLSHRFHGKGSGKKKTEKRLKKVEEEQVGLLRVRGLLR